MAPIGNLNGRLLIHSDHMWRPQTKKKLNMKTTPESKHGYRLRSVTKIFPFQKLPAELRIKILTLALTKEDAIKPLIQETRQTLPNPFINVFLVNRQLHFESRPIAYGMNTFHFSTLQNLDYFSRTQRSSSKYLKQVLVELDSTLSDFIPDLWSLLDPKWRNFLCPRPHIVSRILRRLPRVSHLTVRVPVVFDNRQPNLQYYIPLYGRIFLGERMRTMKSRQVEIDFTVTNLNYATSSDSKAFSGKPLSREVRKSLVATILPVLYTFHLAVIKWELKRGVPVGMAAAIDWGRTTTQIW